MDNHGHAWSYKEGAWSGPGAVSEPLAFGFSSVSCPSASFCLGVGTGGKLATYTGGVWSEPTAIDPGGGNLESVSCATPSFCVTVNQSGQALTYNGSSWSGPTTIAREFGVSAVSCPLASFCAAVGYAGALSFNGSSWSAPAAIDPEHVLYGLSCPSPRFCAATDGVNVLLYAGSPPPPPISEGGSTGSSSPSLGAVLASGSLGPSASPERTLVEALTALLHLIGTKPPTVTGLLRSGGYRLTFTAPTPGVLSIHWRTGAHAASPRTAHAVTIATASLTFTAARRSTITVHLTAAGRKLLKAHRILRITDTVTFQPNTGTSQTKQATLVIKRKK